MKTLLLTLAAVATLAVPASAHRLAYKPASKVVKAEARKIADETDAKSFELRSCKQKTGHKWSCLVRFHYSEDAAYCEVPITVFYKRHSSRRLSRDVGETLCY